jgi:hypothetical protein
VYQIFISGGISHSFLSGGENGNYLLLKLISQCGNCTWCWTGNLDPLSYLGFALLCTTSDDEKDRVDFVKLKFHLNDSILNESA